MCCSLRKRFKFEIRIVIFNVCVLVSRCCENVAQDNFELLIFLAPSSGYSDFPVLGTESEVLYC